MDDLISRQAAIDALGERPMVWVESDYELGARNQYDADVLALETVPSAEPERPKGKWIDTGQQIIYKCSECGNYLDLSGVNAGRGDANFCPSCGADMRGE